MDKIETKPLFDVCKRCDKVEICLLSDELCDKCYRWDQKSFGEKLGYYFGYDLIRIVIYTLFFMMSFVAVIKYKETYFF